MHSITVEDTGCGIPPAHLDKLFHSFFTTKRESGGAGLGLMVCHHIVRAHGGTIAVDSTPGQGSRFVVHLPVSVAAGAEPAEPVHA
jgi:two-component system NtrC family sensor kinase